MQIVFHTDAWRRFNVAECCTSIYDRGRFYAADSFERIVRRGVGQPRHASVGRFRPKDIRGGVTRKTPCFLPWTLIECEAGDILDNLDATRWMLDVLDHEGFDTTRMHLRFSGGKSLWIAIPAELMGNPLATVEDQKALRQRIFLPLAECLLDEHLWDGRHLHRLLGSRHETGSSVRVLPWAALDDPAALEREVNKAPDFRIPAPLVGACPVMLAKCRQKASFHVPAMDTVSRSVQAGGFMDETEEGVSEGERNYAAFRRACVLLRRMNEGQAWANLQVWGALCDPPLSTHEMKSCFRSAKRTVTRDRQLT